MRLVRFGPRGQEKPGIWRDGRIVDLRRFFPDIPDIGEPFFRDGWLERIAAINEPGVAMDVRLGCPVARSSKIICLGINYATHGAEGGSRRPSGRFFSPRPPTP